MEMQETLQRKKEIRNIFAFIFRWSSLALIFDAIDAPRNQSLHTAGRGRDIKANTETESIPQLAIPLGQLVIVASRFNPFRQT
jgi:hypothetical protein